MAESPAACALPISPDFFLPQALKALPPPQESIPPSPSLQGFFASPQLMVSWGRS